MKLSALIDFVDDALTTAPKNFIKKRESYVKTNHCSLF
jgi:hypothetical protein